MDGWNASNALSLFAEVQGSCMGTHICVLEVVLDYSNSFPDDLGCSVRLFIGFLRSVKRVNAPVV